MTDRPRVLFVCSTNGGKSQMAAALMRLEAGDRADVVSAGLRPANAVNPRTAASVAQVGASTADQSPQQLTVDLMRDADHVVIVGSNAQVDPAPGMTADMTRWVPTDPPADCTDPDDQMRHLRDDLHGRVRDLCTDLFH